MLSVVIVVAFAVVVYRNLLHPGSGEVYPLGCDAWGHLFKAQYLTSQIAQGNPYPVLLPWWYGGLELFRYYSPLPIYMLSVLQRLSGDIFLAGAWLVPAAATFGGLSWLFYARRLGWLGALAAGVAWTVWPDHLWVALVDGNLPRAVATALLPLLVLSFVDSLEARRWPWSGLAFVILLQLVILSHAMIAAMVGLALGAFCLVYWLFGGLGPRDVVRGGVLVVLAVLTASWWLFPSLHGGITSISPAAIKEAVLSHRTFLDVHDPRALVCDLVSVGALAWVILTWKTRRPLSKALWVCAFAGVAITVPAVQPFYMALPLSHLMWPARFSSLTAVALLATVLVEPRPAAGGAGEQVGLISPARGAGRAIPVAALVCLGLAVLSPLGFSDIVRGGQRDPTVVAASEELAARRPGWRVALLDVSRLTSQAAYDLSSIGGREQVYGFAYQGAAIGPALVFINTALEHDDYAYAVDRAWQCGATDLVVATPWVDSGALIRTAAAQGFGDLETFGNLAVVSKPAGPQAFVSPYRILAIGRLSGIISMLFPHVETGRARLDSYTGDELARYETLFLTGVEWQSREAAEALIETYLATGGRVVVDLTGFPKGPLNDRSTFLGVTGERLSLDEMPELTGPTGSLQLGAFSDEFDPWVTFVPQGLDHEEISFSYYGQPAVVLGDKIVSGRPVVFLGLNVPYHAYLTRHPAALNLLAGLLGPGCGEVPARLAIPLEAYEAGPGGYSFRLDVPAEAAGRPIILPFGDIDVTRVWLDGREVEGPPIENLMTVTAEVGVHEIHLEAGRPQDSGAFALVSLTCGLLLVSYVVSCRVRVRARRKEVAASNDEAPVAS